MENDGARSRDDIVLALFGLFRRAGYEGVSIGEISAATGLGRSSLYHHFPGGKADMAAAVVAFARNWMAEHLIAPLTADAPLAQRMDRMLASTRELYQDGAAPCLVASLLLNHSGEGPENVGALLVDWLKALEAAFRDAGLANPEKRAMETLIAIEGALVLARATGDISVFDQALARVRRDVLIR